MPIPRAECFTLPDGAVLATVVAVALAAFRASADAGPPAAPGPGIVFDTIELHSGAYTVPAYLARPDRPGSFPGMVVIHANWLVEPYIAETTARLAEAGFVALAMDVFHFLPRVASWEEARRIPAEVVRERMRAFSEAGMLRDIRAGIDHLGEQPFAASGGVGLLGFCGGGWNALLVAAQESRVAAVVAFYAPLALSDPDRRAPSDLVEYVRVPVQYHFATRDPYIPRADVDRFGAALTAAGTPFEHYVYEADHGFLATNRPVFDVAAAALAWQRATDFLARHAGREAPAHTRSPMADDVARRSRGHEPPRIPNLRARAKHG